MNLSQQPPAFAAGEAWKKARRQVIYQKVVCAITHCSVDMRSFDEVRRLLHLDGVKDYGIREIPLEQIKGSVGRYDDFTSTFLPRKAHMQERWQKVDQLVIQGKAPPIEVYQVDQAYFVVDGNHRVSSARQNGLKTIKAHVTGFQSPFSKETGEDIDQLIIQAEQRQFLEQIGQEETDTTQELRFTCVGCYQDLMGQIETYRQGLEAAAEQPVSLEEAFAAWYEEVYSVAVSAIRQDKVLELFPERTEADLFIWAWQNSAALESQAAINDPAAGE